MERPSLQLQVLPTATNVVGVMENMYTTTSGSPAVTTSTLATTGTGVGNASFYMAGLAAWAATNNIRPDLASNSSPMNVKSFVIDVQESKDCAFDKQFWLTAKYGDPAYYSSGVWNATAPWYDSILGNSFPCSSNAPANYGSSTAYMQWPKNLLRAGDPVSMIASVKTAIQSIAAAQGNEAALAQSAGTLNTGTGAYLYQAGYNSGGWTGDVKALVLTTIGNIQFDARLDCVADASRILLFATYCHSIVRHTQVSHLRPIPVAGYRILIRTEQGIAEY